MTKKFANIVSFLIISIAVTTGRHDTQCNDTQCMDTQHNFLICDSQNNILWVSFKCHYAECVIYYCLVEHCNTEWRYAEWHYADCHCTECRGANDRAF